MMKIKINGKDYFTDKKQATLFDLYKQNIPVSFGCRIGLCGTCTIYVTDNIKNLEPKSTEEQQITGKDSQRLGCQCILNGDVSFETTDSKSIVEND